MTLIKLIAPVLTFTAEEAWNYLPVKDAVSVQLTDWPQVNPAYKDEELDRRWQVLHYRDVVMRRLEEARKEKRIGSSLTAALELYPDEKAYAVYCPLRSAWPKYLLSRVPSMRPVRRRGTVVEQGLGCSENCRRKMRSLLMIHPRSGPILLIHTLSALFENVKALKITAGERKVHPLFFCLIRGRLGKL